MLSVTSLTVSIDFRRKAQQSSGDQIDRRQEGDFIMIVLRVGRGLIWLTILAYNVYLLQSPGLLSLSQADCDGWRSLVASQR